MASRRKQPEVIALLSMYNEDEEEEDEEMEDLGEGPLRPPEGVESEPTDHEDNPMELDNANDLSSVGEERTSLLKKRLREVGFNGNDRILLLLAIDCVMLEAGFIRFDPVTIPMNDFDSISFSYTLTCLLDKVVSEGAKGTSVMVTSYRIITLFGDFVVVNGSMSSDGCKSIVMRLDAACFGSLRREGPPTDELAHLLNTLYRKLANMLMFQLCANNSLTLPPCFMALPDDLWLSIIEKTKPDDMRKLPFLNSKFWDLCPRSKLFRQEWKRIPVSKRMQIETKDGWPRPLPENWHSWGKDAVYFTSYSCGGTGEAISFYAVNTNDNPFTVYHVLDFVLESGSHRVSEAACAILSSRANVIAGKHTWFRYIDQKTWCKGANLNNPMVKPKLFTLRGRLYAVESLLCYNSTGFNFQVLDHKTWRSLKDPPNLFPTDAEYESVRDCMLRGLSCIGNDRVILHVTTAQTAEDFDPCELYFKQHFHCFRFYDDDCGEWSILEVRLPESCVPAPFPDDVDLFYRCHMDNGHPLLILPVVTGRLHAFGISVFSDCPELRVENVQEVDMSNPYLDCGWQKKTIRIWSILHVGGGRYCAIAFPQHIDPCESCRGGFFVFSFNVADQSGEEINASGDGSNASTSSRNLTMTHVQQCFGVQHPLPLQSGILFP